jgi:electron transfer flavoprotein alpha subunit
VADDAGPAPRIAVLVKQIPQVQELDLGPDGRLQREGVPLEMNAYCRRAVAKGVELARSTAGTCTVVTLGPPQAEQVLLEALAWGADDAVLGCDPEMAGSDTLATARALVRVLRLDAPFDLILAGRNSLDADTGQVGPAVAELLGLPFLASVRELDRRGSSLRVRCETDDGWLLADVDLPAVVSCAERLCDPAKAPEASWAQVSRTRMRVLTARDLGDGPWGAAGSPTNVGEVRQFASTRRPRLLSGPVEEQVAQAVSLVARPGSSSPHRAGHAGTRKGKDAVVVMEPGRPRLARELLGAATDLADSVMAVTFDDPSAAIAAANGAQRIAVVRGTSLPGDAAATIAEWLGRYKPWAVLAPSTLWGRELSARVAARLGAGLVGDAVDLDVVDGRLVAWKPACAGRLLAAIRSRSDIQLATIRPGVFRESHGRSRAAIVEEITATVTGKVRVLDEARDDDLDILATATTVVGVGSGVHPSEYDLLKDLTGVLDAQLAATRRVTDAGWLPRSRQVGITGRSIAPQLYVAVGVSGKPNHMLGVRGAGTIIAVNRDERAPIFGVADLGIVADWHEAVPLLAAAFAGQAQPIRRPPAS